MIMLTRSELISKAECDLAYFRSLDLKKDPSQLEKLTHEISRLEADLLILKDSSFSDREILDMISY
jgi:hypothetical protein